MTDNEKRAHDLAVAATCTLTRAKIENPTKSDGNVQPIYIYDDYKKIYEMSLNCFNRDFPEGK